MKSAQVIGLRWLVLTIIATGCVSWKDECTYGEAPGRSGVCLDTDGGVDSMDASDSSDSSAPTDGSSIEAAVTDAGPADDGSDTGSEVDADREPECETSLECSASSPLCLAGVCQACETNDHCARFDATPACGEGGACVTCLENSDCNDPLTPICADDGSCRAGCRLDAQCSRNGNADWSTTTCRAGLGICVECLPGALETSQCLNGRACNPTTMACTGSPVGSVAHCMPCISDTECSTGLSCVVTSFNGTERGSYCLREAGAGACPRGAASRSQATSVSGYTAAFCFPNASLTTCEAVTDFAGKSCLQNNDCGAPGLDDGFCALALGGARLCTYKCSGSNECGQSGQCSGTSPDVCQP